ncbi:hypothetical protein pclt_cds_664 [Pandoravirus celtis]|uniref:Uncharacterized protein n=1 Tax=Pandoravirus celtis TaxID=2568002 RepID=A0A4D6EIJ8_9VIRU|nr:hypothetical protein pclt_cds_664 [Pandoravirus celtis]
MLRRHQTLALDGVAKVIHYYDQESPLADDAHVAARLLQAFIAGLVQAPSDMDRDRAMTAARRVAATLIDPIVRFDAGRPLGNVGTVKSVVSNARSAVYHAATSLLGKPLGDAVVYLMGALVVSTERWASCPSQPLYHSLTYRDTFALLARADSLTLEALAEALMSGIVPERRRRHRKGPIRRATYAAPLGHRCRRTIDVEAQRTTLIFYYAFGPTNLISTLTCCHASTHGM